MKDDEYEMIGERLDNTDGRFNFKCPSCSSEKIEFKPIGTSWKPITIQEDLVVENRYPEEANLTQAMVNYFNNLPYLKEVLLGCDKHNITGYCNECRIGFNVHGKLDQTEFRTWLNEWCRKTGNEPPAMVLRSKGSINKSFDNSYIEETTDE